MKYSIINADVIEGLKKLDEESIDCVMTSPPYWGLRDYGVKGQIGLEPHPQLFIDKLVEVFREVKRVLKKTGSVYLNLGDTYFGSNCGYGQTKPSTGFQDVTKQKYYATSSKEPLHRKVKKTAWLQPKQLMLMPSRVAIALQESGWILRNDIIWAKPNPMPSSVKDRLNTTFEHVFHFVKSRKYYYDLDAIREPHKNMGKSEGIAKGKRFGGESQATMPVSGFGQRELFNNPSGKNPGDVVKCDTKLLTNYEGKMGMTAMRKRIIEQGLDESVAYHPLGKNPGDFWSITTQPFKGAHFAVFPEALCLKPLKSSVPKQVCVKCGKARERIIERIIGNPQPPEVDEKRVEGGVLKSQGKQATSRPLSNIFKESLSTERKTIGFTECGCGKEFGYKAGTVLDPFMGAGTVLKVAQDLRLNAIGIELKPEYCEMAKNRLKNITKRC